jgi:hypothetical protein
LENSGSIIISSCLPGEYSWAFTYIGGIYTLKFIEALKESTQSEKPPMWQNILDRAAIKVTHALAPQRKNQTPQYDLQLTSYEQNAEAVKK